MLEYRRGVATSPVPGRPSEQVVWDMEEIPPSYAMERGIPVEQPPRKIRREYRPPGQRYTYDRGYERRDYYYDEYPTKSFWDSMGFYNVFWDPRYNLKIPVMQIVAIVSLIIIFILNYTINYELFEVLAWFSPWVAGQPPAVAWIFALMLALFISIFPTMNKEFRVTLTLFIIIILIIGFLANPALAFFSTYDAMEVGKELANSLIGFTKVLVVMIYWGPILFGVYGIFSRERMFIFISVVFSLGVIIANDIVVIASAMEPTKTEASIPLYTIFALTLFCYYEMSDSSVTFYEMNDLPSTWQHQSVHQEHLDRILQKYFLFFIFFSAMALVLTTIILGFNDVLIALGSEQVGSSIELSSMYGTIISLFVLVIILIIIGYLIRNEDKFRDLYKSLMEKFMESFPQQNRGGPGYRFKPYHLPPPPPPRTSYAEE